MDRTRRGGVCRVAGVVLAATLLASCDTTFEGRAQWLCLAVSRPSLPAIGAKTADVRTKSTRTRNTIASILLPASAPAGGFGVASIPRRLHPPFRWEIRAGAISQSGTPVGPGFFCMELDVVGSDPLEFYGICAQPVPQGLNVFVIRRGNNAVGQVLLEGATVVDLGVEADGSTLRFRAAAPGDDPEEVASIPFTGQGVALEPTLGAVDLPSGARVDFDLSRVAFNHLPATADATDAARERLFVVGDRLLDAHHALDDGREDRAGAAVALAAALAADGEAAEAVDILPNPVLRTLASDRLLRARRSLVSAQALLERDRPSKKVLARVTKALKALIGLQPAADDE